MPKPDSPDTEDRTAKIASLRDWVLWQGIHGAPFDQLLETVSERLVKLGVPLMRVHTTFRALHPTYGAIGHRWENTIGKQSEEFGTDAIVEWHSSPLYHMLVEDLDAFRARLDDDAMRARFPIFRDLHARGGTDYYARRIAFVGRDGSWDYDPDNPPEGMMMSLTCNATAGFSDRDIDDIETLLPALAIALKTAASRRMATDLLSTYLGPDAGRRVLSGEIDRGSSQQISAVILLFDLSGFTRLSETLEGTAIIDLLNDYYSMVVDEIDRRGGNVLKFLGDGLLAVFSQKNETAAGRAALDTVRAIRGAMAEINAKRQTAGQPVTGCTMALHAGDVLYGNIGGQNRLDFTVIGPAVNTTARLSSMCAHVDQPVVISARVARPQLASQPDLVSLGQYRMRGVSDRIELFTLD